MCGYRASAADILHIEQRLHAEMAEAAWTLATLVDIGHDATVACLHTALSYHLGQIQQRLFWLLSFLYDPQAMLRAQDHLTHGTAEKRAYALEIIDVLVSQHLKTGLVPSTGRGHTGAARAASAGAFSSVSSGATPTLTEHTHAVRGADNALDQGLYPVHRGRAQRCSVP